MRLTGNESILHFGCEKLFWLLNALNIKDLTTLNSIINFCRTLLELYFLDKPAALNTNT